PGLVTYLVASLTLDRARSCVMQIAFLIQRKVSSISISPDGFLPSIMLLVVIIVSVVIVVVTVVLVVVVGEAVTFPSMLLSNPPMKTSISFSEFGTIFGHKIANF
ncbi:hypothetical protein Tco_0514354, partial [Tanacetum coccineum]